MMSKLLNVRVRKAVGIFTDNLRCHENSAESEFEKGVLVKL